MSAWHHPGFTVGFVQLGLLCRSFLVTGRPKRAESVREPLLSVHQLVGGAGQRPARIIMVSTGEAGDGWLWPMSSYPHDL